MKNRKRWIAIAVAVAGIGVCLVALVDFLTTIRDNDLPWRAGEIPRDLYIAVGESYSQGFTVGFFLCFFLIIVAVCVVSWVEQRRAVHTRSDRLPHAAGGP